MMLHISSDRMRNRLEDRFTLWLFKIAVFLVSKEARITSKSLITSDIEIEKWSKSHE